MKIVKIIITIVFILVMSALVIKIISVNNDDCLKAIAEDYCEDQGMSFHNVKFFNIFSCEENERAIRVETYKFLEDEIEGCKNNE